METHRPPRSGTDAERRRTRSAEVSPDGARPKPKRRDAIPLDEAWLEEEATRSLARADSSRRRLIETVERKLRERCERTGEGGEPLVEAIPAIVDRLVDRGYVDDERLATHLFEKGRKAGRSHAWIEEQLRAKGIESDTLAAVERARSEEATGATSDASGGFAHAEEVDAAFRIARKKRLGPYCPDPDRRLAERQRHLGFLARRGFSSDVAHHVIDAVIDGEVEP